MAYIEFVGRTDTTLKMRISGLDTSYIGMDRVASWCVSGNGISVYENQSLGAGISQSSTCTISGLEGGTLYDVQCIITYYGGSITLYDSFWTAPAKWNWNKSNGSASADETQLAYYAITNKGNTSDFSYLVWNDFIDKIYELMCYKEIDTTIIGSNSFDVPSSTTYTDLLNEAYMYYSDKRMTARRFNIARYCIGSMKSTGLSTVSPGDIIYGSYFISLANALNNIE